MNVHDRARAGMRRLARLTAAVAVLSLAPRCTYVEDNSLDIGVSLTIHGNGDTVTAGTPGMTIISVLAPGAVSLDGLRVTGGAAALENFFDEGTLTVAGSTFTRNTSLGRGGAIGNDGMLTVSDSTFWGNTSAKDGGAISNDGTATLANDVITGNEASAYGGGLDNDGTATLTNVVIAKNKAHADGGGIRNRGSVTLTRTQVKSNTPDNCAPAGTITGCAG
jgi:predicted outer membrane repeat protein